MRSRVVVGTILLVALGSLLATSTCGDERSADPAGTEASSPAATEADTGGPDSAPSREPVAAPAAIRRPARPRAAAPVPREPDRAVVEDRWFHEPVTQWETEKRIEITATPTGVLVAKWIEMSDSGVELERLSDGKTLWRVHVEPLGIQHSGYHQEVTIRVDGDRVVVESVGAQKIVEVRDLATGVQTSREVTDVRR